QTLGGKWWRSHRSTPARTGAGVGAGREESPPGHPFLPSCRLVLDRHHNAAKNVLWAGQARRGAGTTARGKGERAGLKPWWNVKASLYHVGLPVGLPAGASTERNGLVGWSHNAQSYNPTAFIRPTPRRRVPHGSRRQTGDEEVREGEQGIYRRGTR